MTTPYCRHIRLSDPRDVASAVIEKIGECGAPLRVYVEPNEGVGFTVSNSAPAGYHEFALIGIYDDSATTEDIADDIEAAQRERIW